MSSTIIATLIFACLLVGALFGGLLRRLLPHEHVSGDSKDAMKLGTGLIGTMTALVLGLLVASAKSSYDTQKAELTELSANVILLDRLLAHFGPEATETRTLLRRVFAGLIDRLWATDKLSAAKQPPAPPDAEMLAKAILQLPATTDVQRAIKAEAQDVFTDLGRIRMLMFAQVADTSISVPFVVIVVFWLTVMFFTFGLLAPRNATVVCMHVVCALSAAAAVFLILELDRPFSGLIRISNVPAKTALAHLGQ